MRIQDYGLTCKGHWRAGSFGYYEALRNRPKGHVTIEHDSQVWLYDLRGLLNRLKEFRRFVHYAWGARGAQVAISGSYPHYQVETRN